MHLRICVYSMYVFVCVFAYIYMGFVCVCVLQWCGAAEAGPVHGADVWTPREAGEGGGGGQLSGTVPPTGGDEEGTSAGDAQAGGGGGGGGGTGAGGHEAGDAVARGGAEGRVGGVGPAHPANHWRRHHFTGPQHRLESTLNPCNHAYMQTKKHTHTHTRSLTFFFITFSLLVALIHTQMNALIYMYLPWSSFLSSPFPNTLMAYSRDYYELFKYTGSAKYSSILFLPLSSPPCLVCIPLRLGDHCAEGRSALQ